MHIYFALLQKQAAMDRKHNTEVMTMKTFNKYFIVLTASYAAIVSIMLYLLKPISLLDIAVAMIMFGMVALVLNVGYTFIISDREFPKRADYADILPVKVAVLYTTYNDVVPDCLKSFAALKSEDGPVSVSKFALDDSSKPGMMETVDSFSSGCTIIRRTERKNFKAGAINNWLFSYGKEYNYFITLDADSKITDENILDLVAYASHKENAGISIFQSCMRIWNRVTKLAYYTSLAQNAAPLQYNRITNYFGNALWFGHNALCRTKDFLNIDGMETKYISEDFATSCKLLEKGLKVAAVPVITEEGIPNNIAHFMKRSMRWCIGGYECLKIMNHRLPLSVNYRLWTVFYGHVLTLASPVFIVMFVFFRQSILANLQLSTATVAAFWILPLVSYALLSRQLKAYGLGIREIYGSLLVSLSTLYLMAFYEWFAVLKSAIGRKPAFTVTPKGAASAGYAYILPLFVFVPIVLAGAVLYNQLSMLYGILWMPLFVAAPFVLLLAASKKRVR